MACTFFADEDACSTETCSSPASSGSSTADENVARDGTIHEGMFYPKTKNDYGFVDFDEDRRQFILMFSWEYPHNPSLGSMIEVESVVAGRRVKRHGLEAAVIDASKATASTWDQVPQWDCALVMPKITEDDLRSLRPYQGLSKLWADNPHAMRRFLPEFLLPLIPDQVALTRMMNTPVRELEHLMFREVVVKTEAGNVGLSGIDTFAKFFVYWMDAYAKHGRRLDMNPRIMFLGMGLVYVSVMRGDPYMTRKYVDYLYLAVTDTTCESCTWASFLQSTRGAFEPKQVEWPFAPTAIGPLKDLEKGKVFVFWQHTNPRNAPSVVTLPSPNGYSGTLAWRRERRGRHAGTFSLVADGELVYDIPVGVCIKISQMIDFSFRVIRQAIGKGIGAMLDWKLTDEDDLANETVLSTVLNETARTSLAPLGESLVYIMRRGSVPASLADRVMDEPSERRMTVFVSNMLSKVWSPEVKKFIRGD